MLLQVAMLFTSMTGQRRLRIHNLSLNVCSQMADLFKNVELDTLVNYISKAGWQLEPYVHVYMYMQMCDLL